MSQQPMAYLSPEFLESEEARPIRILAEYLEPLRRFKEQKIQDTVVFFGSARVDSRDRAERALKTLRARGEAAAPASWKRPTAAPARPAARRSASTSGCRTSRGPTRTSPTACTSSSTTS